MTAEPYAKSTVEAYLGRLSSAEPEPGGGSAAALVGAMAADLARRSGWSTLRPADAEWLSPPANRRREGV